MDIPICATCDTAVWLNPNPAVGGSGDDSPFKNPNPAVGGNGDDSPFKFLTLNTALGFSLLTNPKYCQDCGAFGSGHEK